MDLSQLQTETDEWRRRNFPQQSWVHQAFGVIEELGELVHAHLKENQGIRGTAEEHQAAAKDSVADLGIFLMGYCSYAGVDLSRALTRNGTFVGYTSADDCLCRLARWVGVLADTEPLESNLDMREHAVRNVWFGLMMYCNHRGWDFDGELQRTWDRVKKRDWLADPTHGGESNATGLYGSDSHLTEEDKALGIDGK